MERPGFGISTFQEDRTLMSFAEDVKVFAKAMGLEKYSVVGYSAGGPYALACAALKDGALNKVCIISSVGALLGEHLSISFVATFSDTVNIGDIFAIREQHCVMLQHWWRTTHDGMWRSQR